MSPRTHRSQSAAERQAARHLHTRRGAGHERAVAEAAWHCAGAWQAEQQMDIWQCIDQVELDMRESDVDDEDPSTDTDDEQQRQV